MNLNIEWTPVALQSLDEVFEYTFEEFGKAQVRKLAYCPLKNKESACMINLL